MGEEIGRFEGYGKKNVRLPYCEPGVRVEMRNGFVIA